MAQPFLNRRKVLLGAIQADVSPIILDASDGGLLIKEAASTALELVTNDRSDVARDTLSSVSDVIGSKAMSITAEGELIPSGDILVPPSVDAILRVSGMERNLVESIAIGAISDGPFIEGETVTGDTSGATGRVLRDTATGETRLLIKTITGTFEDADVISGGTSLAEATASAAPIAAGFEYKPISTGMEWGTFSLWEDDYQKTIHSAMATISFNFEASLVGSFSATIKGPVTFDEDVDQWGDGTMAKPTFSDELPPVLNDASLKVSDADGSNVVTSLIGQKVTFDVANEVVLRRNMNAASGLAGAHISKRNPVATLGVEYLSDAQYPVFQRLFNNEDSKISFRLGDGTIGETIEAHGKINFTDIGTAEENGLATNEISCKMVDNGTGDTEYSLLFI